jgi:LacI family transcriptional regulator
MAAETLLQKKKRRILSIFGNTKLSITQKRLKAYTETFLKYNTSADFEILHANSTTESFEIAMSRLNKAALPDAVFCMSDEILIGVMKAIQTNGLRTPGDIGVIAISEGLTPKFYYPEITYIETSGYKLAKMAFSRMLACLAGSAYVQELKIESLIVEGGSL